MRNQTIHRFAIVLASPFWTTALSTAALRQARAPSVSTDKTTVKQLITEPATLVSLRFEWWIDGDDNRNATSGLLS